MTDPNLQKYIEESRKSGFDDDQIRQALIQSGWQEAAINQALAPQIPVPPPAPQVPVPQPPTQQASPTQTTVMQPGIQNPNPQNSMLPNQQTAAPQGQGFNFTFDEKTKKTVMWSAIGYAIFQVIGFVAGEIGAAIFFRGLFGFSSGYGGFGYLAQDLFMTIIWGLVLGAVIGFVIAKFYNAIVGFLSKFGGRRVQNMFGLIFYPTTVSVIVSVLFSGGISALFGGMGLFLALVIGLAGEILGAFIYAKLMSKKIGAYYNQ